MQTNQISPTPELDQSSLAPVQEEEVDILELLILLAKNKRNIARAVVASTLAALVISFLIPNRYTGITKILPPQQSQSASMMLMNQFVTGPIAALAGGNLGLKSQTDLYIGVLKSRTIQDALVTKFDLKSVYKETRGSDVRKALEEATKITSQQKEGLITISVEDRDPKRAAAMANAYVEELRNILQRLAITEASRRRLFFEDQLQRAKDDLANAEVALKESQQKTGMIQLDSQSKAIIEAVARLRAQIAAKEVQLQAMGSFATEQNPDYVIARQELHGLRNQLSKMEQQQPSADGEPLMATGRIPAAGLEYIRRLREVKYRETIFELLAKQFEAAKLDEAKDAAVVQVLDPAVEPDRKSSPRRSIIVVLGMFVGIMIAVAYTLLAQGLLRMREDAQISDQISRLKFHFSFNRNAVDK